VGLETVQEVLRREMLLLSLQLAEYDEEGDANQLSVDEHEGVWECVTVGEGDAGEGRREDVGVGESVCDALQENVTVVDSVEERVALVLGR